MNKQYLSWENVEDCVSLLAKKIKKIKVRDRAKITLIAIARGGLPIVSMLSHKLGIDDVRVVTLKAVGNSKKKTEMLDWPKDLEWDYKQTYIVVDEIHDSGDTMGVILDWIAGVVDGNVYSCTLVYRDLGKTIKPDFWAKTVKNDNWIVFPWEKK